MNEVSFKEYSNNNSINSKGTKKIKSNTLLKKKTIQSDLFELIGSRKVKTKSDYEFEDLNDEIDHSTISIFTKVADERVQNNEKIVKPTFESLKSKRIDWRAGNFYSNRYKFGCFFLFLCSFINFSSAIIYYELDYSLLFYNNTKSLNSTDFMNNETFQIFQTQISDIEKIKDKYIITSNFALTIVFILTILAGVIQALKYSEYLDWKKSINLLSSSNSFVKSKEFKNYILQSLITLIHPFIFTNNITFEYWINNDKKIEAKLNYIFLTIFLVSRYFYMINYLIVSSYYYSPRAQRFGSMYKTDVSLSFALKCILKSQPLSCYTVLFCSNMFLGGYLIRIWERFASQTLAKDLDNIYNSVWYAFITMSTVGYGDMSATSPIGRLIASLVAILGVLINSTLTVIMAESFNFKGGELKAYNMLNHIKINEEMDLVSKKFIKKSLRLYSTKLKKLKFRKNNKMLHKLNNFENKLIIHREALLKQINDIKEIIRTSFKTSSMDIVIDKLVYVKKSANLIKNSITRFGKMIDSNKENNRNLVALQNEIILSE